MSSNDKSDYEIGATKARPFKSFFSQVCSTRLKRCAGGSWNLQIFHWRAGTTISGLSSDTDIESSLAACLGTLEVTPILLRCPVINFANLPSSDIPRLLELGLATVS